MRAKMVATMMVMVVYVEVERWRRRWVGWGLIGRWIGDGQRDGGGARVLEIVLPRGAMGYHEFLMLARRLSKRARVVQEKKLVTQHPSQYCRGEETLYLTRP